MSIDSSLPTASIESTSGRPAAIQQRRLAVPWTTVLPLAAAMAYADGFWMISVRGAVGSIERTQTPFGSWWRESTLVLPVVVLAVLGVFMLAMRWFGPVLRTPKALVGTALMLVAAGSVVGLADIVLNSAYDYHLQSQQLRVMETMRGACSGNCAVAQQHLTLVATARAVVYESRWVVLTNLVLVAWLVAMRGARLKLSTTRRSFERLAPRLSRNRSGDVRLFLVAALVAAAAIHAAVISEHLSEWPAAGWFFLLLSAGEVGVAAALVPARAPQRGVLAAAAALSGGPLVLWLLSRTVGMPFGPDPGVPEAIGLPDCVACVLEIGALLAALVLLRAPAGLSRRPRVSAHGMAVALVAVLAVTAFGLAASGLSWFDLFGFATHSNMSMH